MSGIEEIAPFLLAASAGAAASTLLAPKPSSPAAPGITPPTTMPTPGDDASRAAKRLSLMQQMQRQGRASTILTDSPATGDKLGA